MRSTALRINNENGFVLVVAMMMLVILCLLGALATSTSVTELLVAGSDKVHKQTFYQADGGTELAQHLIYQNAICTTTSNGFSTSYIGDYIFVEDLSFAKTVTSDDLYSTVSDSNRSFAFYPDGAVDDTASHTNFLNTSKTTIKSGSSMSMVSGYDGLGSSSVSSTAKLFTIASQHQGTSNSLSTIQVQWQVDTFILASASSYNCEY